MTPKLLSILDKWQAVTDAATAGPWEQDVLGPHRFVNSRAKPADCIVYRNDGAEGNTDRRTAQAPMDFEFIALARTEIAPRSIEALKIAVAAIEYSVGPTRDVKTPKLREALRQIEEILCGEQ